MIAIESLFFSICETKERSILIFVERKTLQIAQARIAGAEIIEGDPDTRLLERVNVANTRSGSSISRLSVTSSSRRLGASPVSLSTPRISFARSA